MYVIHKIKTLKLFDYKKVKAKERQQAENFFEGDTGKKIVEKESKTFTPGEIPTPDQQKQNAAAIKAAIEKATTEEEIQKLEATLKEGKLPQENTNSQKEGANGANGANGSTTAMENGIADNQEPV